MPSSEASRNGSRGNGSRRSRTTSRKSTRRPAKWSRSRPERRTESSRGEAAGRDEGRKEVTPKRKARENGMGPEQKGWEALLSPRGSPSGLTRQVAAQAELDRRYPATTST